MVRNWDNSCSEKFGNEPGEERLQEPEMEKPGGHLLPVQPLLTSHCSVLFSVSQTHVLYVCSTYVWIPNQSGQWKNPGERFWTQGSIDPKWKDTMIAQIQIPTQHLSRGPEAPEREPSTPWGEKFPKQNEVSLSEERLKDVGQIKTYIHSPRCQNVTSPNF